ncbi:MAG: hypothetical protein PHH70_02680 [Candidatus Gracilibacteria bacterium]|nr:hypothetical protein [Candidatus Gracilibacteria bacterium]
MFQKLVEIVQVEIREELGEDTTDGNSFLFFFGVERTSRKESIVPIVRNIAINDTIYGIKKCSIICMFSDFLLEESMIDGEEVFREINLTIVCILYGVFFCSGDEKFTEILDRFVGTVSDTTGKSCLYHLRVEDRIKSRVDKMMHDMVNEAWRCHESFLRIMEDKFFVCSMNIASSIDFMEHFHEAFLTILVEEIYFILVLPGFPCFLICSKYLGWSEECHI